MNDLVRAAVENIKRWRELELARCVKACFRDEEGNISLEGQRVIADLREKARLFESGIRRDGRGVIDHDDLVRIEGRREIVLRLINLLELDPMEIARFVEVDDGRN